MSEEIKFEPVFGDQSLFDGAPEDAEMITKPHGNERAEPFFFKFINSRVYGCSNKCKTWEWCEYPANTTVALRRIIPEPKRWTLEDQKAGRLPEVGAELIHKTRGICEFIAVGLDEDACWALKLQSGSIYIADKSWCQPIETPEERAQRLEDEWVSKAWSETAVFAGVTQDEHDRLRMHLRHIYRAQLSGELPMPKKGGE